MSNETMTAMLTAIDAVADTTKTGGVKNAVLLVENEDAVICGVVLKNKETTLDTRARVRVALRALKEYFPAKGATWRLGSVAEWGKLPEAMREEFADKMPKWGENDSAYVCTGVKA